MLRMETDGFLRFKELEVVDLVRLLFIIRVRPKNRTRQCRLVTRYLSGVSIATKPLELGVF